MAGLLVLRPVFMPGMALRSPVWVPERWLQLADHGRHSCRPGLVKPAWRGG